MRIQDRIKLMLMNTRIPEVYTGLMLTGSTIATAIFSLGYFYNCRSLAISSTTLWLMSVNCAWLWYQRCREAKRRKIEDRQCEELLKNIGRFNGNYNTRREVAAPAPAVPAAEPVVAAAAAGAAPAENVTGENVYESLDDIIDNYDYVQVLD